MDSSSPSPIFKKDFLLPLLTVSFLLRLAYVALKWSTLAAGGMEYETLADSFLAHGRISFAHNALGPVPSAFMPPGVTFVLILSKSLWPSAHLFFLAALQLALAAAALLLIARVAEQAGGPRAALWACVLYAFDINLFIPVAWVNETIYTLFLLLLAVALTIRLRDAPSAAGGAAAGAAWGFTALFRSTMLPQFPLAVGWLLLRRERKTWTAIVWASLAFAAILAPWTIRNYRVLHRIIPVSQNLGVNLWQGWNPLSAGSEFALDGGPMPMEPELAARISAASSEPEWNDLLKRAAFRYAAENPARWLKQRALSFLFFWHEHNFWAPRSPYYTPAWRIVGLLNIPFVLLFFACAAGVARMKGVAGYLLAVIAAHALIHTLIHADIGTRFRYQIEPLMLVVISLFFFTRRPAWGDRIESVFRLLVVAPGKKLFQKRVSHDK